MNDHGFSKACPSGNHMLSMRDEIELIRETEEFIKEGSEFWWSEIGESWWCEYSDGGI